MMVILSTCLCAASNIVFAGSIELEKTKLHMAAIENNEQEIVRLVSQGEFIYVKDKKNCLPVHYIANWPNSKMLKLMLEMGVNPNTACGSGKMSLLHWVMQSNGYLSRKQIELYKKNRLESVGLLLQYGANINIKDIRGNTPLHLEVISSNTDKLDMIRYLLKNGADPNVKNNYNKALFDLALESRRQILGMEYADNISPSSHNWAALQRNNELLKVLMDNGAGTLNQKKTFEQGIDPVSHLIALKWAYYSLPLTILVCISVLIWFFMIFERIRTKVFIKQLAYGSLASMLSAAIWTYWIFNADIPGLGYVFSGLQAYAAFIFIVMIFVYVWLIDKIFKYLKKN